MITYSPSSQDKKFRIAEDEIKVYKIDQEVNLFKGNEIKRNYSLNYIRAKISIEGNERQRGAFLVPSLRYMELSFSEGDRVEKLIKFERDDMDSRAGKTGFYTIAIFMVASFCGFFTPVALSAHMMSLFPLPKKNQPVSIIFLGQATFLGFSFLSCLLLLKFSFKSQSVILPTVFCSFGAFLSRGLLIEIATKMMGSAKATKDKVYSVIVVLGVVVWFVLVFLNFRLFFRMGIFYCFLAILDLFFIHPSSSARNVVVFDVWCRITLVVAVRQFCIYSIYNFVYRSNNWEETPLFYEFILPDFCVMVFMLIPFHLVFRWSETKRGCFKRKMTKMPKLDVWGSCEISFSQSADWILENKTIFKEAHKEANFSSFHNIPSRRNLNKEEIAKRDCDSVDKIFNFSSNNPLNSKDFIATGTFSSRPGIRYVVRNRKAWDLILKNKNESLKDSFFIENVWISNQHRRRMMAYCHKEYSAVKLVSIPSRKILQTIDFKASINYKQIENFKKGSVDLVIQPAFKNHPIIVNKLNDQVIFFKAKFVKDGSIDRMKNNKEKVFCNDPFAFERALCPQMETVYFEDLMATKYLFYDIKDNDRAYINHCKYQKIVVNKIESTPLRGSQLSCIDGITEGVFSSCRIDFFCFVDKETLALIADQKVCLVDWKKSTIKRSFELKGLYSPLLNAGIAKEMIIAKFWYNRICERVHFCLGVSFGGRKDIKRFITDFSLISVNYALSGSFKDEIFYRKERIGGNSGCGQVTNTQIVEKITRVSLNQVGDQHALVKNHGEKMMSWNKTSFSKEKSSRGGNRARLPRIDDLSRGYMQSLAINNNSNNNINLP